MFKSFFTVNLLLLGLFLGLLAPIYGQTTVIIGTNSGANTTTSYPCPLEDYYYAQRAQYLYNAAAMSGAGIPAGAVITQIGWVTNATTIAGHLQEGYSISLKNTAIAAISTTVWETGVSSFYGPTNYSYTSGFAGNVVFTGTTPFTYTGSGLLVEVCGGISTGGFTSNPACQWQTAVGYNASHTYRADAVNGCGNATVTNTGTATTRPRMVVTYIVPVPCSGTPNPGNTLASVNPVCPTIPTTLSMQNSTIGTGITYQWQSSSTGAGGSFVDVVGATGSTYTTTVSSSIYYQCVVTCNAGPTSATSTPIQLTVNSIGNCYCTNTNTTNTAYYINNFSTTNGVTNITNNNTGFTAGGYANYTAMSGSQLQGGVVNFSIAGGGAGLTYGFGIWIDYNQDGTFGVGENVYNSGAYLNSTTGSFTVPLNALGGSTRLRVVSNYLATSPVACPGTAYTECEDYTFIVISPPAAPPVPTNITASPTCASGVTLTATGTPPVGDTWYWQGTNPTGTSTASNATTPLTVYSNGTYYIRAYNSTSGFWSTTSASYTVTTIPVNPATSPTIVSSNGNPACATTNISCPTAVAGDYWQTSVSGTSTASLASIPYNNVTTGGTYYVRSLDGAGCWSNASSLALTVLPTISATATATQISSCGGTTGTIGINSAYYNNFTNGSVGNAVIYGNASISGGTLILNPNLTTQGGAIVITDPNAINSNAMTMDFDLITVGAQGADGASYSFGDDVFMGVPTTPTTAESGSGTKFKISFDAYTNGGNTNGVYLMYNCNIASPTPTTPGVLGYVNDVTWCGGVTKHITITISNTGLVTVMMGATTLFSNVALPGGYLSANKATWKHAFAARTGAIAQGHQIDNLNIMYGVAASPLEYSFDNAATWGPNNVVTVAPGTYATWVRYAANPACVFSAGTVTITPFAPSGGTAVATSNPVCPTTTTTLSLSGATAGVTYQWQSSATGGAGTYTDVVGATSATYTTTVAATIYYQCVVSCNPGNAVSTPIQLTVSPPTNCYCTNTNTTNTIYYINNFSTTNGITNITNNGTGFTPGGYANYTALSVSQIQGGVVNFSITGGGAGYTYGFGIWIDYNQDGVFGVGENVYNSGAYLNSATGSFTVPLNALGGNTRMRVVSNYLSTTPVACPGTAYTECEDYTFTVVTYPIDAAVMGISVPSPLCAGNNNVPVSVQILNTGTNSAAVGAISVTLTVSGANSGTYTTSNSILLANSANQVVTFTGVNLSNSGTNNLSVTLTYTGDMLAGNNTTTATSVTQTLPPSVTATANPPGSCNGTPLTNVQLTGTPAQILATTAATYNYSVSTGLVLEDMTGATTLLGTGQDDAGSAVNTIPFTFTFAGINYTQFSANSNGVMALGATPIVGALTNGLTTAGTNGYTYPILTAWWDDLHTGTNGGVVYKVFGANPNQKLVVEWKVNTYPGAANPFDKTMQIWLYQGSNIVQTVYGAGVASASATIGIAASAGDYESITTPANTKSTTASNDLNNVWPVSGTSYIFNPAVYNYSWTPNTNLSSSTIINPVVSSVATTTTYLLTVTSTTTGCTSSASSTIYISNPSVSVSSQTNVNCFGGNTGNVSLVASGGVAPYQYALNGGAFQPVAAFFNMTAGTYTIDAKDANNCTASTTVTITEPVAALSVGSLTGQNVSCLGGSNGSITISGAGGTPGYQYQLNSGGYSGSGSFTGLSAGTYNLDIKDVNNCTTSTTYTITAPGTGISASIVPTNVACFGNTTGAADLTVSGGGGTYTYSWSNGATSQDLTGIGVGTYTVDITDNNLCTVPASVTITGPAAGLAATISGTNVLCFGNTSGGADLTVTGGTTTYTYSWLNGATSQDLTNIGIGTYSVTVTDANLCTVPASVTITGPATGLSASIAGTNVLCLGNTTGAADLTASGGTGAYTYSWSNGATSQDLTNIGVGTYSVTVTDANLCTVPASVTITGPITGLSASIAGTNVLCFGNTTGAADLTASGGTGAYTYSWSNGATSQDLTNIGVGTYSVIVTDANLCPATTSVTITGPAAALAAAISGTNVLCFGNTSGGADLTVTGGTTAYTYSWSNGATSQDLTNIGVGTYSVTVTDANLCTTPASVTITGPASAISASETHTNILCFGGMSTVTISATGGTGAFTGTGTFSQAAGTTTYTVSDANGCSTTVPTTITQPAASLLADAGADVTICNGSSTTLSASATGGTTGYTYNWNNGASQGGTVSPSATTTYTVTVTDANGCTDTDDMTVTVNAVSIVAAPSIGVTYVADYETTDVFGWTHYYDDNGTIGSTCDDYLLLSLQKNGNTIGTVGNGTFFVTVGANPGAVHITNPPADYVTSLDWYVMNRYWLVTPTTQPLSDIPVRFYYTTADFDSVNNTPASAVSTHTDLKFYKINGSGYNPNPAMGHAGVPAAPAYNQAGYWQYNHNTVASTADWAYVNVGGNTHYAEYVVGAFSGGGGGGGGNGGAFPVELLNFTGYEHDADNVLEWVTKNESNNKGFKVLKSTDNVTYSPLDMVFSKAPNGTSNEELSYQFIDKTPATTTYYRLMQIDIDGNTHLSNQIVEITRTGASSAVIVLYPNPAKEELNISITNPLAKKYMIKIYDIQGKLITSQKEDADYGVHICKLDITKLAKGAYTVVISNDLEVSSYRFIKE